MIIRIILAVTKSFRGLFIRVVAVSILLTTLPNSVAFARQMGQAEYASKMDVFIQKQMQTYKIPGLAVAIVRGGNVEFIKGYGVANADGDPITPDTPFLLASVSKSFTALGVMQLIEAEKLNLDDPVQKYLPWFAVAGDGGAEITVAHLLYQTSGFSEFAGVEMNLRPDNPDGLEVGVRDLYRIYLSFQPGQGWEYSNINYNVLGLLIQEISGQSYASYIQENIFGPLDMTHSHISLANARLGDAASSYYPFFGIPLAVEINLPATVLPAAGLWASAADMSRYLIAHLGDGSAFGLSASGQALLHAPGIEIEPGYGYAMGWFHAANFLDPEFLQTLKTDLEPTDDLQVLWHEGDWKGYKAMALLLPTQNYGVILLMNTNDPTITSVFKNFAWDVTLIANGGEAFYFPPGEGFIVRHSRWIFSGLSLLLLAGLVWSSRGWRLAGPVRRAWVHALPVLPNLGLLVYVHLILLPDNNASLQGLLNTAPDLGLLTIIITLISTVWIVISVLMLMKTRSR